MAEKSFSRQQMAKFKLDYFEDLESSHSLMQEPHLLFRPDAVQKLWQLRLYDESAYQKKLADWKVLGVKVGELRKSVDKLDRKIQAQRKLQRVEGDDKLIRNSDGEVQSSPENIRRAIGALGVRLSYDLFKGEPLIGGLPGHGPALNDYALRRLWLEIDAQFRFRPPQQLFNEVALDLAYQKRFHPVADFLDFECIWDGKPRLDRWLIDYAGAKDTPYVRAVSAMVLIAAVRRIRVPGTKFDEMLVLESAEQGLGKSTLVAALAVFLEWFTDSVPLNADDKRMMEAMAGKWIAEIAELQGMKKGEVEHIRSQLSRQADRARMAYARLSEERPRQYIMIGTTNATTAAPYLADLNGNRRYWPVEVGRCDIEGFIEVRRQIWAEASEREAKGESIRLPESLWVEAGREQQDRSVGNAFADKLAPILGAHEGILGIPIQQRDAHAAKFGMAMKSLGWERSQRRLARGATREATYSKGVSERLLAVERDPFGNGLTIRDAAHLLAGDMEL
jgi:hypothetical protein